MLRPPPVEGLASPKETPVLDPLEIFPVGIAKPDVEFVKIKPAPGEYGTRRVGFGTTLYFDLDISSLAVGRANTKETAVPEPWRPGVEPVVVIKSREVLLKKCAFAPFEMGGRPVFDTTAV
jgi:hypothetical protein